MSEMSNKESLNKGVMEAAMESEGFSPGSCLISKHSWPGCLHATALKTWSKKGKKMVLLSYLLTKEGLDIGYIRRMYKYCKDYRLFELEEQHLVCHIRSTFKTDKLSKVEVEGLMRQINTSRLGR